jgi:WD40 repeat protein
VYDSQSGRLLCAITHTDEVNTARFDSEGTLVVTASDDGTSKVVAVEGCAEQKTIKHTEKVSSARFAPDPGYVLTVNAGVLRLWDTRQRLTVEVDRETFPASVNREAFFRSTLIAIDASQTVHLRSWRSSDLISNACQALSERGIQFEEEDWTTYFAGERFDPVCRRSAVAD